MNPEALGLFEKRGERFLLEIDNLRSTGVKVAGVYCTFAPPELIRAAGAIPVGLCGKRQDPIPAAEADLPANLCPLIKSSYGYAISDTCPFFAAADILVGETTCDGKKKMFELMGRLKPMHVMHLPYGQDADAQSFWLASLRGLQAFVERHTGRRATSQALAAEIALSNRLRERLLTLAATSAEERPLLTGRQMTTVMEARNFTVDQAAYLADLEALLQELDQHRAAGVFAAPERAPRILLTGCPVGKGSDKVLRLLEECGAVVVAQENCTNLKPLHQATDTQGDPLTALARRSLATPCSCLTPNPGRFALLDRLAAQFRAQAVVDLTWHACHTYNVEATLLRQHLQATSGLPCLHIDTDYSDSDSEPLRTRLEAFLEMLR